MSAATPLAQLPPPLRAGSVVRVVAPSSAFAPTPFWRGLGWLAERYRVRFERGVLSRTGFLAGDDARRRAELEAALIEPDVAAIVCARGGYGANRFAHAMDWSVLRDHPRWIVGFSDVTALHLEATRVGVASLHASHVTGLGQGLARRREQWVRALETPSAAWAWEGLEVAVGGEASGPLVGGNLTLVHACAAAGRLDLPAGAVLLIEDVTELPYRIDRMLTTLRVGGHFDALSAIVVGEMTGCRPGRDGVTAADVLRERLTGLGIPVVLGAPVGHGVTNRPFVVGARVHVSAHAETASVRGGA